MLKSNGVLGYHRPFLILFPEVNGNGKDQRSVAPSPDTILSLADRSCHNLPLFIFGFAVAEVDHHTKCKGEYDVVRICLRLIAADITLPFKVFHNLFDHISRIGLLLICPDNGIAKPIHVFLVLGKVIGYLRLTINYAEMAKPQDFRCQ